MSYPSRLVPKLSDKKITNVTSIIEDILCRWVSPGTKLKDQQGALSPEAVEEKRLFGYSTNKIPPSLTDDIFIGFHDSDKFNQDWQEGTDGVTPTDEEYYSDNARGYFLVKIKDIHKYESKYPYPADANAVPNYVLKLEIAHKPLISNVSHFEFEINFYEINGVDVAKVQPGKSSASRKLILADLRQHLIKKSKFSLDEF